MILINNTNKYTILIMTDYYGNPSCPEDFPSGLCKSEEQLKVLEHIYIICIK